MTTVRRPPGRYDEPRALPRPVQIAGAVLLVAALTAGAWWAYQRSNRGLVEFGVVGYVIVSDSSATVTFDVRRRAGQSVLCRVEALASNNTIVGGADQRLTPSDGDRVTTPLITSARATSVVVTGCRLEPSPRPQSP